MQEQIDEINSRLDDLDTNNQDLSDNIDTQLGDVQTALDEQSTSIDTLNETSGQLQFPLSQDSIDLINEVTNNRILFGIVTTDVNGLASVSDPRLTTSSVVFTQLSVTSLTVAASCSAGIMNLFVSLPGGDNKPVQYLIIIN